MRINADQELTLLMLSLGAKSLSSRHRGWINLVFNLVRGRRLDSGRGKVSESIFVWIFVWSGRAID